MANWRLLDVDPLSGMKTWHGFDEETETTLIRYDGDAEGVLDVCKEESNHLDKRAEMNAGPMVHVARVPPSVQMEWLIKYGVDMANKDHRGAVHRLLDGEYKHLKRLPIILGNY